MADEEQAQPTVKSKLLLHLALSAVVGFVSGGLGFLLFSFLPGAGGAEAAGTEAAEPLPPIFLPFGEVVVNLDEGQLTRYLRTSVTLQVAGNDEQTVTEQMEKNRSILKSWLLSYLSDKNMEDIRGAAGQNRLRREIQDHYNSVLFPDGNDLIQDVLFEEFTVQ